MSRRKVIQRKTPHETPRLLQPRPITKPYSPESYSSFFLKDIADEITAFARSTDVDALSPVAITNVTPIASYSWIEASSATLRTIAVPGSPRFWYTDPHQVPVDSGRVFVDQNAYNMYPKSPLIPLFAAIDDMHPSFNYKQFDFITDRNNLHKLLCWAVGTSDENFRIDVDVRGSTCLFTRCEQRNSNTIHHSVGHGHEYEKAATRVIRGCEKTTGHYRMISIDLGGMKILLRFAVDACTSPVKDADDDSLRPFLRRKGRKAPTRPRGKNSYVLPAQGVFITRTTPRKLVPQASLVEIKACASHRAVNWVELYPRLYLSQTAFLYIAKHHRGNFNPPEKVELGAENMLPHARHAEQGMVKLKVVLQNILDAVKKEDHRVGLSLVCKNGQLTLYRRQEGTGKALGCEITSKFK